MAELARLIAPHPVDRFLVDHWGKRARYIAGDDDKFAWLKRDVGDWLPHAEELEAATRDDRGLQRQMPIDRSKVEQVLAAGLTICANVTRDPTMSAMLRRFAHELALPGAPFAKIYASPPDGGFALHLDKFHVFVCQTAGTKRWRYSSIPAVQAPIASGKLDDAGNALWSDGTPMRSDDGVAIHAPDEESLNESMLTQGDCLYLPPGCWHVARAVDSLSIAISISPPRTEVVHLVTKVLEELLTQRADWRRDVFAPDALQSEVAVPPSIAAILSQRVADLRKLLDTLDERALHRVWRLNASSHGTPGEINAGTIVERGDTLRHSSAAVRQYLVAPQLGGADEIFFYAGGSEWSLPIEALTFIEHLATQPSFVADAARAWDPSLDWDDVKEILEQLVDAGLLTRCAS